MSDETAFLTALRANPADDTARLIYADWLDEHDEPAKAEYLRRVAEVARDGANVAAHPDGARLCAIAIRLAADWRCAAGSHFCLVLDRFSDHVRTIKWIRDVTNLGLGEAKTRCETLPCVIYACVPFEMATAAYRLRPGDVRIASSGQHPPAETWSYQVVIQCKFHGSQWAEAARRKSERETLEGMTHLLSESGVTLSEEEIRNSLLGGELVLPGCMTLDHAQARKAELVALRSRRAFPLSWYLFIEIRRHA